MNGFKYGFKDRLIIIVLLSLCALGAVLALAG
jgi:hypothetical protein